MNWLVCILFLFYFWAKWERELSSSCSTSQAFVVLLLLHPRNKSWMSKWSDFDHDKRNISVIIWDTSRQTEHISDHLRHITTKRNISVVIWDTSRQTEHISDHLRHRYSVMVEQVMMATLKLSKLRLQLNN